MCIRDSLASGPTDDGVRAVAMHQATLVVVPTYDEVHTIAELLARVRRACPAADVLVVDDASPDGTAAVASAAAQILGGVDVLVRPTRTGLGGAYRAGFTEALSRGYDVVVEMDADLSHEPEAIPALLGAIADGCDLAIGSRYVEGGATVAWPARRRLLSRVGGRYATLLLSLDVRDPTSGFRAYRTDLLRAIGVDRVQSDGFGFQIEMTECTRTAGGRITEVPITFEERVAGESKMSAAIAVEAFGMVTRHGTQRWARRMVRAVHGATHPDGTRKHVQVQDRFFRLLAGR